MGWFFSKDSHLKNTQVVLGIDGGGTKTHAILSTFDGKILREVFGGPTNPASVGLPQAVATLGALLSSVLKNQPRPEVSIPGLAGIDTAEDAKQFFLATTQLRKQQGLTHFEVINDGLIALANGSEADNALILIAGTGSICYGRTPTQDHRAGGMDYLLSDEGSGYWLGLQILRQVVKSADGREPQTIFTELVREHFAIRSIDDLKSVVYTPPLTKTQIAEVARLWDRGLAAGDSFSTELLANVVKELTQMVEAVVVALKITNSPFDLVLAGSIATHQKVIPLLRSQLVQQFPQMKLVIPNTPPVHGALVLAKKLKNQ